ncbi:MAG TPA: cytochrome c peroxidase [Anaeromyxobacteraceae bacterium]|nr:cytochrome c peroxidase [Anaeromyxobacteraceae bacterium]
MRSIPSFLAASTVALALGLAGAGCSAPEKARAPSPPPVAETAADWEAENPIRPLPEAPLGVAGELADLEPRITPAKVRLGRWLFFDPRLSSDGKVSCATCHQPKAGFSEQTPVSTGVEGKKGNRKAPPVLNAAFPIYPVWFWDGRAGTLAEQAKGPVVNPVEMGMTHAGVEAAVRAIRGYGRYFAEAFGDDHVDLDRIAEAIAAYEATRMSGNSAFDRWDAGDPKALDEKQKQGFRVFFGKAACNQCHLGPNLTDSRFHNLGVGWRPPAPGADPASGFADPGRARVTGRLEDTGAFKTPTLRDVSRRAPYMHDGSVATLRDVVLLYDRGGTPNPWLAPEMKPLHLTPGEVDALVAFLAAFDGEGYQDEAPRAFPR